MPDLDPASRRRPDESREPSQRLGPGFHREPWIPAFAGMTILIERAVYKQTLIIRDSLKGNERMFLEEVAEIKRGEIAKRKSLSPLTDWEKLIPQLPPPRGFIEAISRHAPIALIAEIKRSSPSAGVIKEDVDLQRIASAYEAGGACAISVLTEAHFFKGDLSFSPR